MSPYWSKPLRLLVFWPVFIGAGTVTSLILARKWFELSGAGLLAAAAVSFLLSMFLGYILADLSTGLVEWFSSRIKRRR